MDNLSRRVASRVDEMRMVVADRVSHGVWVWGPLLEVQTEKPTPACSSLSLLTMVLGSMRLIAYLLMAIKRISGKFGSVVC